MPDPDAIAGRIADLELMRDAVAEAGSVAREIYEKGFEFWRKEAQEPVTDVDMAVNAHLKERLLTERPDYGWLSEETVDDRSRFAAERVWVVDPIDGTRALMKGLPHFVIAVALVVRNKPVLGIVYNPVTDERFEAMEGEGATLNGRPLKIRDRETLRGAKLLAYGDFLRSRRWRRPWPEVATDMVNSIAYRLMLVAAGRYDGVLTVNAKSDWDLAAATLILEEAGGACSDIEGRPFEFNTPAARHEGVLAGGPQLHERLERKMRDWQPKPKFSI